MTPDIIRDFQHERAILLDLLCEARQLLAGSTAYLDKQCIAAPYSAKVRAFLDRGLYGDKTPEDPPEPPDRGNLKLAVGVGTFDANGNPKGSGW